MVHVASVTVMVVGGLSLLGWLIRVVREVDVIAGFTANSGGAAVCLILLGGALQISRQRRSTARLRGIGIGLCVVSGVVGAIALCCSLGGGSAADSPHLSDGPWMIAMSLPGRMTPGAAVCTLLSSLALIASGIWAEVPSQVLSLIVLGVSTFSLVSHLFRFSAIHTAHLYGWMALHTAMSFALLSLGIVCMRPDAGLMGLLTRDSPGGTFLRYLIPAVIAIPTALTGLELMGRYFGIYDPWVGTALFALLESTALVALLCWAALSLDDADSRRQHAEAFQRITEDRMQRVLASNPAVIYSIAFQEGQPKDPWWSENIRTLTGEYPPAGWGSTWWLENVHPEDRAQVSREVEALTEHEHRLLRYRFRCQDGVYRWIHDERRLVRGPSGEVQECVGSWMDITEQKSIEEQLRQSQKMEAIGQLAGGVAHDFNNLLTVINGSAELVLDDMRREDPSRELVVEIGKAGHRAALLTRQLLAFSRKQVLEPSVLNLNMILKDMEPMLRRLIGENIQVAVTPAADLWNVNVDVGQIQQVVMNLAVNARDAIAGGGRFTIETRNVVIDEEYVRLHQEMTSGEYVVASFADTGSGMDAATRARIFEPFFTTKSPERGTGLGLATVFGIIRQSGGFIEVYSEVGLGTTFKIYFPRVTEGPSHSPSRDGTTQLSHGTETILLAEDEDSVRDLARQILQRNGYTVLEARDGNDALRVCTEFEGAIHLLVSDVIMPHLGGQEAATRLLQSRPDLRVLYLSGYTDDAVVRHGVLHSDVFFLQKPFSAESLVRKVREVLDAEAHPPGRSPPSRE